MKDQAERAKDDREAPRGAREDLVWSLSEADKAYILRNALFERGVNEEGWVKATEVVSNAREWTYVNDEGETMKVGSMTRLVVGDV